MAACVAEAPAPASAAAPAAWTACVVHQGSPVTIRPIGPDDLDAMRRFVAGLSMRTAYQRLLSPRVPTERELWRWTHLDASREAALVALAGERMVGVARYVSEYAGGEAEFAIVLADEWQGQGLGGELLRRLIEEAKCAGVPRLVGTALSTNARLLALARRLGFRARKAPESAVLTLLELAL
jgi:RimJ/RimL family protein N-acetyltransferase